MSQVSLEAYDNAELSDEQIAALAPDVRLVEAGPGAGKTKTVVARIRNRFLAGHRVALLSFTNAAVDVARARCRDVPGLLDAPNFVGTFDLFFHRYVVTPALRRQHGRGPTYVSSWDDLPSHLSQVCTGKGSPTIRLSTFARSDTSWVLNVLRLNRTELSAWNKVTQWRRDELTKLGSARLDGLVAALVFDTQEARRKALEVLQDGSDPCLGRLARRFGELVVDEFQDCDEIEHQLLGCLRDAGINVVTVADPDQAIYEFRHTSPDLYVGFRAGLEDCEIASLNTCYRSTPVICALASALRSVGTGPVTAHADHPGGANRVHVIVGAGVAAGRAALAVARRYGLGGGRVQVIAHRRSDARALVRPGAQPPAGSSQMERLLASVADLVSGGDAKARLSATRKVEAFVLDQLDWDHEPAAEARPGSREEQLDRLGMAPERLRAAVGALLTAVPSWTDARLCSVSVYEVLAEFARAAGIPLLPSVRRRLVVPAGVWNFWLSRSQDVLVDAGEQSIRWGHVHGVKGHEFDAVVMALPAKARPGSSHVLDDWEAGTNSEQRRVLYVGVSRARRVLVLVVPKGRRAQLEQLLGAAGVAFEVETVG